MMLHTFTTLGCPELDLDGAIALAARHGMHTLELRTLNESTDLPACFHTHYGTPVGFAAHLRDKNFKICVLDTSFKLIGHNDVDRAQLIQFVQWAEAADIPWLRVFDGGRTADAGEIAEAAATLKWWREMRYKNAWAVDFIVETIDSIVTSKALKALFAQCPEVKILWDTHHTWKKGGEAPAVTWKTLRKNVIHLHVKDSVSVPSPNGTHPYTYVMPGEGEFPMAELMNALRTDKFNGVLSLEWERMWHPYLPELDKALYHAKQKLWW